MVKIIYIIQKKKKKKIVFAWNVVEWTSICKKSRLSSSPSKSD